MADNSLEAHVLIVATGGTICMQRSPNGFIPAKGFLEACLAPRPSFNNGSLKQETLVVNEQGEQVSVGSLTCPPSQYGRRMRYSVLEFHKLLDSSSINASDWASIAQTVFSNYQSFDGFIVLHGTDSLAYTAAALSFMLQDLGKPVILTGSQVPMSELQNDATDNLLGSLIIASHFMIPEVCLFFNYKLFRGNRATKTASADFNAFTSPNLPPLATVSAAGTQVFWHLVHRPRRVGALSVQKNIGTAHVACLRIFPGIKAEMIQAVLDVPHLKGLIVETFGSGNVPEGPLIETLANAVENGVVVVNITQCLSGKVSATYASATVLGRAGIVFGQDMTSEAALTKLAYLLGSKTSNPREVAEKMSQSLRGELTDNAKTRFQHPASEQLPTNAAVMAAVAQAIANGEETVLEAIVLAEGDTVLNGTDTLGNTALHLAAVSKHESALAFLLSRGASVHVRNNAGHTPLFVAAESGSRRHVEMLRLAGAHLHSRESVLLSAMSAANGHGTEVVTIWQLASSPPR